ncbi:MAG: alanine--glyoxylate aminotransferase [Moraxellaceae bacterium]|nr:MAG: alanine--glyoxylate aminotransferase [Moraxellaceae bacterium]
MTVSSFIPPKRTLMGPGPSDVPERVLQALSRPTIGHLDPEFIRLMDETKFLLQQAFHTKNQLTIPVSAPGSAGMETCFANLLEPGDKAIVCQNGVFGMRMRENVERMGANAIMVEDEWGTAVDVEKVEQALKANPDAKLLAFVHAETSTGVESDVKALCALAHQYDCLSLVDAVTSVGGIALKVDEWGVDAVYTGTQKCLSSTPGISPVSFSDAAVEVIKNRHTKVQSWFLDLNLVMGYWGEGAKRAYHHTAPINPLYGLHEALLSLHEEGNENAWQRHRHHHNGLKAGLEAMGLEFAVQESIRLPQLNAVSIPDGIDDAQVRGRLLNDYSLELGAGLGKFAGNLWRIGLMGASACEENVSLCVTALDEVLSDMGAAIEKGAGPAAVLKHYA